MNNIPLKTHRQGTRAMQAAPSPHPRRSAWLFGVFRRYAERYVRRHFHAVRVSKEGPVPDLSSGPIVIVMNHPSWWDPMIGLVLTRWMPPDRIHYAPIEEQGLAQYRFLERLGFFGIEVGTMRGYLAFLRRSQSILSHPKSVFWITAQGEFVDPRARPIRLKKGIGHLAHRLPTGTIIPMAIEYPFWNDRCPEALVRFGAPNTVSPGTQRSPAAWTARIEHALQETQDRLGEESRRRDPAAFTTILGGSSGVGGIYDLWRRVRARLRHEPFEAEHQVNSRSRY
jgi:1-acyl-sn-glycerol-3-phosphate acyltransferase